MIGISMGGVVTRYALAEMEQQYVPHDVAHFVSIDAPQQGAVVDGGFQAYIRDNTSYPDAPKNLTSMSGRQLLKYNAFDYNYPSEHNRFYNSLRALNGGTGYPRPSTNVGVTFGTSAPNVNAGLEWLEIHKPLPNEHFYVVGSIAEAGSYLPRDVTNIWGVTDDFGPTVSYRLERKSDPTFIPYTSALDISPYNGTSPFQPPLMVPSYARHHNTFPDELREPLLTRLGFLPPPTTGLTFAGPSSLGMGQEGSWHVLPASAPYFWEYRILFPNCSGGGGDGLRGGKGDIGLDLVTCGEWHVWGMNSTFTYKVSADATLEMRIRASEGSAVLGTHSVCIGNCGGGSFSRSPVSPTELEADADFALGSVYPNPATQAQRAVAAFSLSETGPVTLALYDATGREVTRLVDGSFSAGHHRVVLPEGLVPGVYALRLGAGSRTATRTFIISR